MINAKKMLMSTLAAVAFSFKPQSAKSKRLLMIIIKRNRK